MKKKMILALAAFMVMGLSLVAFSYSRTTLLTTASCCCCSGDSCPMKDKKAASGEQAKAGCDCCTGDSCPMKNKDAATGATACDCCGDSCPMKKSGEKMAAMNHDMKMSGTDMPASCPMMKEGAKTDGAAATAGTATGEKKAACDCACCKHDKEKAKTDAALL